MFYQSARDYINRLIHMQRHMLRYEYKRVDHATVVRSIDTLETLLSFYKYDTNEKMTRFWRKYRYQIRMLLPTARHPGYSKLLAEFESLDSLANESKFEIWQSVSLSLSRQF